MEQQGRAPQCPHGVLTCTAAFLHLGLALALQSSCCHRRGWGRDHNQELPSSPRAYPPGNPAPLSIPGLRLQRHRGPSRLPSYLHRDSPPPPVLDPEQHSPRILAKGSFCMHRAMWHSVSVANA